jgi:hypothetical protein
MRRGSERADRLESAKALLAKDPRARRYSVLIEMEMAGWKTRHRSLHD